MREAAALWRARSNGTEATRLADAMLEESEDTEDAEDDATEPAVEASGQDGKTEESHDRFIAWATAMKPAGGGMSVGEAEARWARRF